MIELTHDPDCDLSLTTKGLTLSVKLTAYPDSRGIMLTVMESCTWCRAMEYYTRERLADELVPVTIREELTSWIETFRSRINRWGDQPVDRDTRTY